MNPNVPMRIIVSGRTAAGKSTQCRLLAAHYQVPYVSMRSVMASLLRERGLPGSTEGHWSPVVDEMRALDDELDLEADRQMLQKVESGPGIFDAWALPWLCPDSSAVRIWIEADLQSRIQRCRQSALDRELSMPDDPEALLREKDEFSRKRFHRLYGFEFEPSSEVFDIVAENSQLLPELHEPLFRADAKRFNRSLVEEIEVVRRARGAMLTKGHRVPPSRRDLRRG